MRPFLRWPLAALVLALPGWALAQDQAYTRVPTVLYVAPDDNSNSIAELGPNQPLWLYGCDDQREWCQVSWNNITGWLVGDDLVRIQGSTTTYIQQYDQWPVPVVIWGGGGYYDRGYPHRGPDHGPRPPGYPGGYPGHPGQGYPGHGDPDHPGLPDNHGPRPPHPGHPGQDRPEPGQHGYTGTPPAGQAPAPGQKGYTGGPPNH